MVVVKKILDFYINSSLHVALSAFALVLMTQYFFEVKDDFSVAFFTFFGSILLYKVANWFIPLRVSEESEQLGLDLSQHNEKF